jgi:hypothetical protein
MLFAEVKLKDDIKRVTIPKSSPLEKGETCIVLSLFEYNKLPDVVRQGLCPLNKTKNKVENNQCKE